MHELEETGGVVFPANQESALPLNPNEETLDDPSALVATQSTPVLGLTLGGQNDRRDSAPPENASGSAPNGRRLCTAHIDFTYETRGVNEFEIGSSSKPWQPTRYCSLVAHVKYALSI